MTPPGCFRALLTLALGVAGLATASAAAPAAPTDLGQGLAYFRVHELAADAAALDAVLDTAGSVVVDIRYAKAGPEDAARWEHALARHHGTGLLCVLVSPSTPEALAGALRRGVGHCTTLGVDGSVPQPRVVVEQTPAADRQAYDALETGTPLASLLSGRIEKERYDEESLMNDFSNGNTAAEPPAPDPRATKDAPEKPPRLVDRVLQRALHLHQALAALKQRS